MYLITTDRKEAMNLKESKEKGIWEIWMEAWRGEILFQIKDLKQIVWASDWEWNRKKWNNKTPCNTGVIICVASLWQLWKIHLTCGVWMSEDKASFVEVSGSIGMQLKQSWVLRCGLARPWGLLWNCRLFHCYRFFFTPESSVKSPVVPDT